MYDSFYGSQIPFFFFLLYMHMKGIKDKLNIRWNFIWLMRKGNNERRDGASILVLCVAHYGLNRPFFWASFSHSPPLLCIVCLSTFSTREMLVRESHRTGALRPGHWWASTSVPSWFPIRRRSCSPSVPKSVLLRERSMDNSVINRYLLQNLFTSFLLFFHVYHENAC